MTMPHAHPGHPAHTAQEFSAIVEGLARTTAPAWPSATDRLTALSLVIEGVVVACGRLPAEGPVDTDSDATAPHAYRLRHWTSPGEGYTAVNDRLEIDLHGRPSVTHIDTLGHFSWRGETFDERCSRVNGTPVAPDGGLARLAEGIIGRGVLIDVTAAPGGLPRGDLIGRTDLEAALERQGVAPGPADILFLNFGRPPAETAEQMAGRPQTGLDVDCFEFLTEWAPPFIVSEGGVDPRPTQVAGVSTPFHVLLLAGLGIHLVDNARLDDLARACQARGRYEFACVLAPVEIPGATASLLNPLVIL
jgi:hypothetical protein